MAMKQPQKRAGLTASSVRQGKRREGAKLTPADDTLLTAQTVTRKYSPRARKCACGCGVVFKPKTKRGRYFSEVCRKRDECRRKAKTMKPKAAEPILSVCTCLYCGNTFFAEQGRGAKYCTDSHKELAYRQRREATIQALIGDLGIDEAGAVEMVERIGMQRTARYLRGRGYQYNDSLRGWLVPMDAQVAQG